MSDLIYIILALVLVVACGVFVAAEFSFVTVNRNTIEGLANKGDRRAKGVLAALKNLSTQLSGAQVGITITNLAIGFLAEPAIAAIIEEPLKNIGISETAVSGISVITGILLATFFTMIFGELIPKNLALAKPMATAKFVQSPQRIFSAIMKYPIKVLNGSANFLLRRLGISPQEELASARSADELSSLVRRSAEKGTLSKETATMLERTLVFDELTAIDVMTPRLNMKYVKDIDPVAKVLVRARGSGISRFPVISDENDDILGIIHLKNVFSVPADKRSSILASEIMRPPVYVPSSIPLDALLKTLRGRNSMQLAIVVDEFGGIDGLVTLEDVLEELVDELSDEHDRPIRSIRKRPDGTWFLSGLLRPDEVAEETGIYLPDDDEYETIAGLVTERLERLPVAGDELIIKSVNRLGKTQKVNIKVRKMDHFRVELLSMKLVEPNIVLEQKGNNK